MSAAKKEQPVRSNPLEGSSLFNSTPPVPLAPLPPMPTQVASPEPAPSPVIEQPIQTQPAPQQTEEPPLLYKSQPSAEYLMRPYDRQRDKQALNADPYKIGAVEAICKLMRITKTDAFDEMMDMFLAKYADILESRPDVVRLAEQKYREKHHI